MKKLMVMMVVLGTVAFGRDMENRERHEFKAVAKISQKNTDRSPKEFATNKDREDHYWELMHMDRGNQDK